MQQETEEHNSEQDSDVEHHCTFQYDMMLYSRSLQDLQKPTSENEYVNATDASQQHRETVFGET